MILFFSTPFLFFLFSFFFTPFLIFGNALTRRENTRLEQHQTNIVPLLFGVFGFDLGPELCRKRAPQQFVRYEAFFLDRIRQIPNVKRKKIFPLPRSLSPPKKKQLYCSTQDGEIRKKTMELKICSRRIDSSHSHRKFQRTLFFIFA